MKVNKEKYKQVIEQMRNSQNRRKNIADYFLNFSRLHRPWLYELAEAYKAKKDFPMIPIITLAHYYHDHKDQEVAAFAGLLLKPDCSYENIQAVNEMFQYEPREWFTNRQFVQLSIGDMQNQKTAGVFNWRWAQFFDNLYEFSFPQVFMAFVPGLRRYVRTLGQAYEQIRHEDGCNSFQALSTMVGMAIPKEQTYYYRILLMVLGTEGGFGVNRIWNVPDEDLRCPVIDGIRNFLKLWFPNYTAFGTFDEAVALFGFKYDCDFLYAYLGYLELLKTNREQCLLYEKRYLSWYECGSKKKPYLWRNIQPEINL